MTFGGEANEPFFCGDEPRPALSVDGAFAYRRGFSIPINSSPPPVSHAAETASGYRINKGGLVNCFSGGLSFATIVA
jgi:hypothetical protein